jgi:type I restriction enzyme, S subunit
VSLPLQRHRAANILDWAAQLPAHWAVMALKRLFRIVGGSTPDSGRPDFWDGNIAWATPSDLGQQQPLLLHDTHRTLTQAGLSSCAASLVPAGSLILSTRAPIGSLAVAAVAVSTNQGCRSLVPIEELDSRFFAYLLSISSEQLRVRGKGSTFLELSGEELGAIRVPVPPLAEQQLALM